VVFIYSELSLGSIQPPFLEPAVPTLHISLCIFPLSVTIIQKQIFL